ncbi:MAG: 4-hydroxy-tetrahydrodipicolinate synthase [Eubacteriales bacterium]|nr:4-hydroxy-tetrahydrodipicolinate synthase [Eubacteriales bacterium]
MANPLFRGSAVALVTPFQNGEVDLPALRRLVDFQIENGTAAIVACGTTGEPATMIPDERETVVRETVKAAAGRIPIICGTGSNCTQTVIDTEKRYRNLGCAAQLVVTPYYNKTTQEGLYAHFMAVAEHTELPIVLYNVPSRTNLEIMPETIRRLLPSGRFIALKESSFQMPLIMEKVSAMDGKMALYSGNDDMIAPLLALGAQGVISVVANMYPRVTAELTRLYFAGDSDGALNLQIKLLPLVRALFSEVSPIPCKYGMEKLGLCSGELRLPLIPAGDGVRAMLVKAMEDWKA